MTTSRRTTHVPAPASGEDETSITRLFAAVTVLALAWLAVLRHQHGTIRVTAGIR